MNALTLLMIRHAEKPKEDWHGPGLTHKGEHDKESLVVRGWQRAGAWTALFGTELFRPDYPKPLKIYAAMPGPPDRLHHGPSRRPFETISALAERLGLQPNLNFAKGDEEHLVRELLALSGVVLLAWEHDAIVKNIVPMIPILQERPPTEWPEERFDVVLRFDRTDSATQFTYRMLCPQLLSGDPATGF
ncbi:MAG: histidine phosphatase family protein [Proteobacteria bacterium]|nr:histidine phosphatase family protein [Pseudomonadota bacterium]